MDEKGLNFLLIVLVGFPMFIFAISLLATFFVGAFNWITERRHKRLKARQDRSKAQHDRIEDWEKGKVPDWR